MLKRSNAAGDALSENDYTFLSKGDNQMEKCDFCSSEIDFHEIVECIASALDAKDPCNL